MEINEISGEIVDAALKVHSKLGPGLLENAYHKCLMHELYSRGLKFTSQTSLPIEYDGFKLDAGYRIDLIVEDLVIIEIKAVEAILPIHEAQLLTYLKLSGKKLGLLINFNSIRLKHGIKRLVNNL